MKLYKSFLTTMVALALGISQAEEANLAPLSTALSSEWISGSLQVQPLNAHTAYYQFEALNFSLVGSQQMQYSVTVSNVTTVYVTGIRNSKILSKDLLNLLATALHTNWPLGAKLALDHVSNDIFVVNKSGTNPVFNLSDGLNIGDTNVVFFGFDADPTLFSGKKIGNGRKFQQQTFFGRVFLRLYIEQNGVITTDVDLDGLKTTDYKATSDLKNFTIQNSDVSVSGDGPFLDGTFTVISGKISGSGNWLAAPAP